LRRELRRAHRQLESGHYAQAYPTLRRQADAATLAQMPVQAATLYALAAQARVQMAAPGAHNAAWDAVGLGQRALYLLSEGEHTPRAHRLLAQILQVLERKHYHEQAVELRAAGTALLGAKRQAPLPQATLPAACPACHASLRVDEVEWIDDQNAECAYCGSVVRPTQPAA
jgi:hypothetical protein